MTPSFSDSGFSPSRYPVIEQSLSDALSALSNHVFPLDQEQIPVARALMRVCPVSLYAARSKPSYDQSTMDGFGLSSAPCRADEFRATFDLAGEVPAGSRGLRVLEPGQAIRIMTGGMIPRGCHRVVPYENCLEQGERLVVPIDELASSRSHIRYAGSDVQEGGLLVKAGTRLVPDHLLLLAENGCTVVPVVQQPRVAVICTGSELVEVGEKVEPGLKISGNGILLSSLLQVHGAATVHPLTVADRLEDIVLQIENVLAGNPDMIVTTGGMGPGKYDLMEQVFERMGGRVVYNRLHVRPGKASLFGTLGRVPLFALPGPPPAVRLLFHEIIAPAVDTLLGLSPAIRKPVKGILETRLTVKKSSHLYLKGAVARVDGDRLLVRPAGRMEPINAIIHLDGSQAVVREGEAVTVRLVEPLHGLTS